MILLNVALGRTVITDLRDVTEIDATPFPAEKSTPRVGASPSSLITADQISLKLLGVATVPLFSILVRSGNVPVFI